MRHSSPITFTLDPWAASSLLQKAIRRGEPYLARQAAARFHSMRGTAIWRRLINIAVEDIGIADLELVHDVVRLASDRHLRDVLGGDAGVLDDLIPRLVASPKDRSADYLYCASRKTGLAERRWTMSHHSVDELLRGAAARPGSIVERAQLTLLACTSEGAGDVIAKGKTIAPFVAWTEGICPVALHTAMASLCRLGAHPFVLMLPLLSMELEKDNGTTIVSNGALPSSTVAGGIPLYTFDKHTSVGKRAIGALIAQNSEVRRALEGQVLPACRLQVAAMAAFYADGVPVSRRLEWSCSGHLQKIGFEADMAAAGCPSGAAEAILRAILSDLVQLNELRRTMLLRSTRGRRAVDL